MTKSPWLIAVVALLTQVSASHAQVLPLPPRLVRGLFGGGPPPDPDRARQELTLTANLLGGYDDNLTPPGGGGQAFAPHTSGYVGFWDSTVRYFFGREAQSVDVAGRVYMNTYRNAGVPASYGGDLTAGATSSLGRRSQVNLYSRLRYDPFFSLGIFGPLRDAPNVTTPDANPTNALTESRSWNTEASANLERHWWRRTRTTFGYSYRQRTFVEGAGFDTRTHTASLGFDQSFGRQVSLDAHYGYSNSEHEQEDGAVRPIADHTIDAGFTYQRHLSRTRRISFSGGAGAMYVDTENISAGAPLTYWAPSGYGSARMDLGRSWSIAADYRRSVSVLEGLTPELFVTDAGTISAGGFLGRRFETVFTAGYSNGQTGGSLETQNLGRYDGYTGTVQLRVLLTRWWSALISVNHYQYVLNSVAARSLGVPAEMHRNSVRVGFSWSVPLYGSYSDSGAREGRREGH